MSNNYDDFDWEKYINYYNDLKVCLKTKDHAIKHWILHGKNENRIYFKINNTNFYYDNFDWKKYINYYEDLKECLFTKEDAINHWINHGKYEKREYFKYNLIITENDLIKLNNNNFINNDYIFDDIKIFCRDDIEEYNYLFNIKYFSYNETIYYDNNIYKNFNNNIDIIKSFIYYDKSEFIFINSKLISFEYLRYWKKKIKNIFDKYDYDIIELTINNNDNFNNIIENNIEINDIIDGNGLVLDAYYISKNGLDKILNNNINILKDWKIGRFSRPLFGYTNNINYNLWRLYYKVVFYWDKIYCINFCYDIEKRKNMKKYSNLLNYNEDIFYNRVITSNIPDINTIIDMNIYNESILYYNIKNEEHGLNITFNNIIKDAINNNYQYTLILYDNITFESDYYRVLNYFFNKYDDFDILILGFNNNGHINLNNICDNIDKYDNYNLYIPKKDIFNNISLDRFNALILSQKALKVLYERKIPINHISDIIFNIKNNFTDNLITQIDNNLKSYLIFENLFKTSDINEIDTEINTKINIQIENNFLKNKSINYLSKIKRLNFKINNNYYITIYIGNSIKEYYKKFIDILLDKFKYYKLVDYINNTDIIICTEFDNLILNDQSINIFINGENENNRPCNNYTDIAILSNKIMNYSYNIYFPQLFTSLWERRTDYTNILNNSREKFCAYMYSYDLEYRVELYNFISKYKIVDALGKSCSNIINDDRKLYNENLTYNDSAVKKYSNYKFVLALENGISDGYITEKIINPIIANSIPIYAGPKDAFDIINKKRVIYIYDFEDYDQLLNYIIEVDNNDELYNSIVSEKIFNSKITWNNFEEYLSNNIDKAFGFKPKNILITEQCINECISENTKIRNNKLNEYDFIISAFNINNIDNKYIKQYLYSYININDKLFIENINYKELLNETNKIKFYIINLDSRKDKYLNTIKECNNNGIYNIERFSAIKPTYDNILGCKFIDINKLWNLKRNDINYVIGASGCKMSHYEVLKKSLTNDSSYKYICILEDDVSFEGDVLLYLNNALKYIENNSIDMDILFFASNINFKDDAIKIDNNLLKLNKGLQTTAQLFKYNKLEKIINTIENSYSEIDNTYMELLNNRYCINPMCVYQKNFYSDILNKDTNYGDIHKKFTY
jgi:GR25 family glycosyltransferase involved in LPS biosynthesis